MTAPPARPQPSAESAANLSAGARIADASPPCARITEGSETRLSEANLGATAAARDLNDRTRAIFRLVVEAYLRDGEPVGSRTIAKGGGVNLSPASVRNVMQDLEEAGLLAAPHISAGRIPTECGLRLFVDGMMQTSEPTAEEQAVIAAGAGKAGSIEAALTAATAALSGLSSCAGLVLVPERPLRLRQFSFVPLGDGRALAVLVGDDGQVENRIIALPAGVGTSALIEAGNYMTARLAGLSLDHASARMAEEIAAGRAALDAASQALIARGLALWSEDGDRRPVLIVRGQAHLIDDAVAHDLDRVRQLLDQLENQEEIARLLESARVGDATRIFIGAENKLFALSGSSIIAAPYKGRDGKVVGVVGVIGPTRLNYARVIPMVDFTAQTLTRLML